MPDVLVVDRDQTSIEAIIPRLKRWAYTTRVVESLEQAAASMRLDSCRAVVLAVHADGAEESQPITTLYKVDPEVRIIAVGDRSSLELERVVRVARVFYYMVQPVDYDELKEVIRRAIGEGHGTRA